MAKRHFIPEVKDLPWSFPVPVSKSHFQGSKKNYDSYNIETDYSRFGTFSWSSKGPFPIDPNEVLYCDLQSDPEMDLPGYLGSGRSGFYKDKYIKGVGRTPLLKAWNTLDPLIYNSGHLQAHSGAKEWVLTHYINSKGQSQNIIPCETVLAKTFRYGDCSPPYSQFPVDEELQTLTIKSGRFARISNFVWMLNHLTPDQNISSFFNLMTYFLSDKPDTDPIVHPRNVAKAVLEGFERGLERFKIYFKLGIIWGACQNNFTLDGRFLDLEAGEIIGTPFIGVCRLIKNPIPEDLIYGPEIFQFVRQMRQFVIFLRYRLTYLQTLKINLNVKEEIFIKEFLFELKKQFNDSHLIFSERKLKLLVFEMIKENLDIPKKFNDDLSGFINCIYTRDLNPTSAKVGSLRTGESLSSFRSDHKILTPHFWKPDTRELRDYHFINGDLLPALFAKQSLTDFLRTLEATPKRMNVYTPKRFSTPTLEVR